MRSVTCDDGRTVLPTLVGSGSPAEGRDGAAVSCSCWGRSVRVVGDPAEVRSQPEVGFAAQNLVFGFWVTWEIWVLSSNCVTLLGYESSLWVGGGLRKMMMVFVVASVLSF